MELSSLIAALCYNMCYNIRSQGHSHVDRHELRVVQVLLGVGGGGGEGAGGRGAASLLEGRAQEALEQRTGGRKEGGS